MAQSPINLVHILKPPKKTVFGSGLRTSFLRVWLFTAIKVLVLASLINGANLYSKVEENVILLDQYFRNDFYAITSDEDFFVKPRPIIPKIIVTQNFEPRGPALADGEVASATTENTQ